METQSSMAHNPLFAVEFQKNLIVWKQAVSWKKGYWTNEVSEELNSVETFFSFFISSTNSKVSEELNSVETKCYFILDSWHHKVSEELNSVETLFFIQFSISGLLFQKNLIVWKLQSILGFMTHCSRVSEELNSVETIL